MTAHAKIPVPPKGDRQGRRDRRVFSGLSARTKVAGIAILTLGIGGLVRARAALSADRGVPQDDPEARERSGDDMKTPPDHLPSGSYTKDNLPPPSAKVQAILERVQAKAAQLEAEKSNQSGLKSRAKRRIGFTDNGQRRLKGT